jgi:orotate phosphoribosyltransferase
MLIKEFRRLRVVKKGNFKLKSGKTSDYYVDIKSAFSSPRAFRLIVGRLCKIIDRRATCTAGSGHGGLPLAAAVSLKMELPLVLVRDKVKKHGIQKMIDGYTPTKKDKVVIIDDVFTTGTCISNILKILEPTNAQIISGYVIVNRGDSSDFQIPIKSLLALKELTGK